MGVHFSAVAPSFFFFGFIDLAAPNEWHKVRKIAALSVVAQSQKCHLVEIDAKHVPL